ncbi:MAG: sigma-54 dependent transcriptional regulator [Pyrinomonadaceae bacterium]|nr:sigma-54 dependent transcriptional regulator [Pyrinomonadaceae bacterium]
MIKIFASKEVPLTEIINRLREEKVNIHPVLFDSQMREKSEITRCREAFFVSSERDVSTIGERTRQLRDLIDEQTPLIVCASKTTNQDRKIIYNCGATHIIAPESQTPFHIAERILAQLILSRYFKLSRCGNLIGATQPMQRIYKDITSLAPLNEHVLITGETGTGKEVVAREIHRQSNRRLNEIVSINIAELNPELIESELFGHEQGSFTNAKRRDGLLTSAGEGTIFLDEIGELALHLQAKLLRVLDEKKIRPVGGNKWKNINARIILATNRNLDIECDEKRFRLDLYHRIKGMTIDLPKLRERKADIPLLAEYFVNEWNQEHKASLNLPDNGLDDLFAYHWYGNVRELRSIIRKAAAYPTNNILSQAILQESVYIKEKKQSGSVSFNPDNETLDEAIQRLEKSYLQMALDKTNGNIVRASKLSGIPRSTFYKNLNKYGINRS